MPKALSDDPLWYKKAIFYELFVRGFFDSNDDGNGDLQGIIQKLDYLDWLGVDCIWLLPFYASPLKDGGYDICDFYRVHPIYGTLDDLTQLIDSAHSMGIRVIADLVLNHTSDQHPWFIESRENPTGEKGDFYIWSDTDQKWQDARVIFTDVEKSNWSFDPIRGQFYWHRFYSHQPDLNYYNEAVQEEMINVVRFWLDTGLDGFRLDAVPYLFQRDKGENLPETHRFLKRLRKEVDSRYPNRVLLAEANQWPADVVDYFGDADECHMCFHFPLMPRMFMAVRKENHLPITEILRQTPEIPQSCQWGLFLRNHDELTLEMVTEDERDFMYKEYAKDPRVKRHSGISRRFASLIDNSRPLAELMYCMLLSLPGSPVIYYGDEILMGDNIYLGDRDGVRTPMQWSPDRNGGFSKADFFALYLPPLMDPVYGYQALNIEAQIRNPNSFLNWLKKMLEIRHKYDVFGTGKYEIVSVDNPAVFAVIRENDLDQGDTSSEQGQEAILCVFNLSRFAQPVNLDLFKFSKRKVVEVIGRVPFPPVQEDSYFLTLSPYGFLWLGLQSGEDLDG